MKLSIREMILIGILGTFIIVGGFYYFVLVPQLDQVTSLQQYQDSLEGLKREILFYSDPENSSAQQLKAQEERIGEITQQYFPSLPFERIILITEDILNRSGLRTSGVSWSGPQTTGIFTRNIPTTQDSSTPMDLYAWQWGGERPAQIPPSYAPSGEGPLLHLWTVSFGFSGSYEQLLGFLEMIDSYDRKIVLQNVSFSGNGGNVTLNLYGMSKPFLQDPEYFEWNLDGIYGRRNPFSR